MQVMMNQENARSQTVTAPSFKQPDSEPSENFPGADRIFWSSLVDQRREQRVDFRTTGKAYLLEKSGMTTHSEPVRIWTVDVSTSGCLIRSYEPIENSRVLLELVLPQLSGALIEARVVRNLDDVARYVDGKSRVSYLYGTQFLRVVSKNLLVVDIPEKPVVQPEESGESIPAVEDTDKPQNSIVGRIGRFFTSKS